MNYIGSKKSLTNFIFTAMETFISGKHQTNGTVTDLFSGTGTVAKEFKRRGYNVNGNDLQYYSYASLKHYLENNSEPQFEQFDTNPFTILNKLEGVEGFIYNNYSIGGTAGTEYERLYFSDTNARKIDAARIQLEQWKNNQMITEGEYFYLLASILESADKVANTTSVYISFLKQLKRTALEPFTVTPVETIIHEPAGAYKTYNMDASKLASETTGNILYLDPPYNNRKYSKYYHLLETIARYDNPEIRGKTGVRVDSNHPSPYSNATKAEIVLKNIVETANYQYIFLSYNDEGLIPFDSIETIMRDNGEYSLASVEYKRYKADTKRNNKKDTVVEYLHCLQK